MTKVAMSAGEDGLWVDLLGPVAARRGDAEIPLGPRRQSAVFAVLALRAGRPVSRAELVSAIWGESPPATASGSVHTYISGLRRSLEPQRGRWAAGELLIGSSAGYTLRIAGEQVDATRFEQLVGQARDDAGVEHIDELLDHALELWRGDPLSGLPGLFAEQERSRLGELHAVAHELRAGAVLDLGGHAEIASSLRTLVRKCPLREKLSELLMLALYRNGQHSDALEVFRTVRTTLHGELGVEPGPELQRLHMRILNQDPGLELRQRVHAVAEESRQASSRDPLLVLPAQVMLRRQAAGGATLVGRDAELNRLRGLVDGLRDGRGGIAWIEGEVGIGKSELLTTVLADAPDRGCQLGWSIADERSGRAPLRVMLGCLGIGKDSAEPLPSGLGIFAQPATGYEHDPGPDAVARLLAHVDDLCAQAPLILVVDDMQWADEASVLVWQRLAASTLQLPLLLVAAARPVPRSAELLRLRHAIKTHGGAIVELESLSVEQTVEMQRRLLGAEVGPGLRDLVERTIGNPLYVAELTAALLREEALRTADGVTDLVDGAGYVAPHGLVDTVRRNLDLLSPQTQDTLRRAALLGTEFTTADIAAVADRRPSELMATFEEAVAAHVVVDAGTHLAFRHPLLRQGFYDGIPAGERAGLHRQAAEALAGVGASVTKVAEQVLGVVVPDPWVLQWLTDNHETVSNQAPQVAAELLTRALDACAQDDPRQEVIMAARVKVLFRLGKQPEDETSAALAITTDPNRAAEMRQLLAVMRFRRGAKKAAVHTIGTAVDDPRVPRVWRQRHRQLLADFSRGDLADLPAVEAAGRDALITAGNDAHLTAHARQTLWLVDSVRRHHDSALVHIDKAILAVERVDELAGFELDLLDNRLFTLQNLDRLNEADETLRTARRIATAHSFASTLQIPAAVHSYWSGRWNEALVELDSVTEDGPSVSLFGLCEGQVAALLLHGVSALIAGRRNERAWVARHLAAVEEYSPASSAERENIDFLLAAQSLSFEQQGDPERALATLQPLVDPQFSPMVLRHQWLPTVVRIAVDLGAMAEADAAVRVSEDEAAKERPSARATAAADWCRGLRHGDPDPVLAAADHFRAVGRVAELGSALEDAAVLLARRGELDAAHAAFVEGTDRYVDLGADWDLERAGKRLAEFGLRRSASARPHSRRGWESLSATETDIAKLVAAGYANPAIAERLDLPRRTVQAHVARLLVKLGTSMRDLDKFIQSNSGS